MRSRECRWRASVWCRSTSQPSWCSPDWDSASLYRDVPACRRDEEPSAHGQGAGVEDQVFAEAKPHVVLQTGPVQEGAPHQRLQEAEFATASATAADVARQECGEVQLAWKPPAC